MNWRSKGAKLTEPRLFLCSGAKVAANDPIAAGRTPVHLDAVGRKSNVNIRFENVANIFRQNLSPRLIDFLEIASYVYSADCATSRGKKWADDDSTEPWSRDFSFVIPVREPEFWARAEIQCLIVDILEFLSSDKYSFNFVALKSDRSQQHYFEFGDLKDWPFYAPSRVIMFSGGLDSLAGAVETAAAGEKLVLVSHRPVSTIETRQNILFKELQKLSPGKLIRVPVWVNKAEALGREPTQRTRSFLFAALGTLVAQSVQANGVRFFENGVVSLNLPIAQEALRSRASRTTHPLALHLLSSLCAAIIGTDFAVDNPFLFKTKTEVVASIGKHQASHLIGYTCSCSRSMFQTKAQPHCGHCSQCIDRRFAILASALQEYDPTRGYLSDVFLGVREDPRERAIAIDYVRHGLELARKPENELAASFNSELSRAVRHVEKRSETAREIISMHKRHGEIVSRVLEEQLCANAAEFVDGTLAPTSLLAIVGTRKHLPSNKQTPHETTEKVGQEGEVAPSLSDQAPVLANLKVIEASLQRLHARIDAIPARKPAKNANARPTRRDSIIFAAIILDLKGMKYCSFLKDRGVKVKWSEPCPAHYCAGYLAGQPWQKKIQDEKSRAKARMRGCANPALADAFNFYLPEEFEELTGLLNSRDSHPASKTLAPSRPHKH